ncbi:MAG: pyridoxamine 5'-phosphate oxidase family protein [Actinomycetota bacterium]|nr:pyridoxamine 5'-phosphate oxidase family protein [Actinomycetota bacterium]
MKQQQPAMEILDRAECLRLMCRAPFGRLVYTVAAMPSVQPVNFIVHQDMIVIRTASESKLAAATRGSVVAFETDDIDVETHTGWSVMVVGRCYEVTELFELAELAAAAPRAWACPDGQRFIAVRIEQVTGRWLHP